MLRFFRILRRKLIEESKIRQYIWYAIGEILLVAIGILIAVQVNISLEESRNENRKDEMLKGLKSEFELNLVQLDTVLYYHNLVLDSGNELIEMISPDKPEIDVDKINDLVSKNGWLWTFDPSDGVLKSSISAGDIHFINNDSLKVILFSWETKAKDAKEEETRASLQYQNFMSPYLEDHFALGNTIEYFSNELPETDFDTDYEVLMTDRKFENLLFSRSINALDAILELRDLYKLNEEILRLIEEEMN